MKYAFHIIIMVPLNKLLKIIILTKLDSIDVRHFYVYNNYIYRHIYIYNLPIFNININVVTRYINYVYVIYLV